MNICPICGDGFAASARTLGLQGERAGIGSRLRSALTTRLRRCSRQARTHERPLDRPFQWLYRISCGPFMADGRSAQAVMIAF